MFSNLPAICFSMTYEPDNMFCVELFSIQNVYLYFISFVGIAKLKWSVSE